MSGLTEPAHEALEYDAELLRIQQAQQPAEGVVARRAVLQIEEALQERLFGAGEGGHIHRALPAAQEGAEGDDQQCVEVVPRCIAGARVLHALKAGLQPIHLPPPRHAVREVLESSFSASGKRKNAPVKRGFKCDSPVAEGIEHFAEHRQHAIDAVFGRRTE